VGIELNEALRPVLLLDGPRGLDALRQFLSARRYLHRQVYYHPTVRGAEILLKGIFARMQDIGDCTETANLTPSCLQPIMKGQKLTFDQFLRTSDVEILYMIRNFADEHPDLTLKYLSELFVDRQFPKCVLDSAKSGVRLSEQYQIHVEVDPESNLEGTFLPGLGPVSATTVTNNLREFVAARLKGVGEPPEAADYLVRFDPVVFQSSPPTDLLFSFGDKKVSLEQIHSDSVGFDLQGLLETFTITRFFVPRNVVDVARAHIRNEFGIKVAQASEDA
jgi:hypothetical protein